MPPSFPSASGYPSASNHPSSSNHPSASGQSPATAPPLPIRRRAETPNPPADSQDPRASRTRTMPPSADESRAAPRPNSPMHQRTTGFKYIPDNRIPRRDFFARFLAASKIRIFGPEAVLNIRHDLLCGFVEPAEQIMPHKVLGAMHNEDELTGLETTMRETPLNQWYAPDGLRSSLCQTHWDKSQELATRIAEISGEMWHYQAWHRAIVWFMSGVMDADYTGPPVPGVLDRRQLGQVEIAYFFQLKARIKNLTKLCCSTRNVEEFRRERDAIISASQFAATQPGGPSSLES